MSESDNPYRTKQRDAELQLRLAQQRLDKATAQHKQAVDRGNDAAQRKLRDRHYAPKEIARALGDEFEAVQQIHAPKKDFEKATKRYRETTSPRNTALSQGSPEFVSRVNVKQMWADNHNKQAQDHIQAGDIAAEGVKTARTKDARKRALETMAYHMSNELKQRDRAREFEKGIRSDEDDEIDRQHGISKPEKQQEIEKQRKLAITHMATKQKVPAAPKRSRQPVALRNRPMRSPARASTRPPTSPQPEVKPAAQSWINKAKHWGQKAKAWLSKAKKQPAQK